MRALVFSYKLRLSIGDMAVFVSRSSNKDKAELYFSFFI